MTAPAAELAVPTSGHIGPEGIPRYTLGWEILQWTADWLLQPDGPDAGNEWRFTREQARLILWWYAVDERGRFLYRRGSLRRMKGWGKDPFGAAISCIELCGPCRVGGWSNGQPVGEPHPAAWIQTAAVAKDQTRNTMTLFPGMLSPAAIDEFTIDMGKEIIYARHGRGRIEAVTSSPLALEGGRPTFVLMNEPQNWFKANDGHAMAAVIARNLAKSRDGSARRLAIGNAHNPAEDSVARRDWEAYVAIATGASKATGVLYDSLEAPPDTDLADAESLTKGIVAARGDSYWVDAERIRDEVWDPETTVSASRRYYLNQLDGEEDAWVTPQEWDACRDRTKAVAERELVTLGFDGSKSNDHSVLMACRVSDSHLFPVAVWDPSLREDGEVPMNDVDSTVRAAYSRFDVVGFFSDYHPFESYVDRWEQDLVEDLCAKASERHPIRWDMRTRGQELTASTEAYLDAIRERALTHSGDLRIDQYHYNARRKQTGYGTTFAKESPFSSRKVDGASASLLARMARQAYLALPPEKRRKVPVGLSLYIPGEKLEE